MIRRAVWTALAVLLLGGWGARASAQTDTPTPVPTVTPTVNQQRLLANQDTCGSPPCELRALPAGGGVKTVAVATNSGTATVLPICRNGVGWLQSDVALASLSGATCTTAANCITTTTAWCDEVLLRVTACSGCKLTGWLRIDPYRD